MVSAALVSMGLAGREAPDAVLAEKKHICFVAPYIWPVLAQDPRLEIVGGAEVQQTILARILRRAGYRVSVICLDFGQPQDAELDGIRVHGTFSEKQGIPVLRFVHPRLTAMWRAMREVNADIYYQRSASHLTAVVAQFCRRHGKRSIYAAASDADFVPGHQQIRFARDRWLHRRGLAMVDRIVVQNRAQLEACRRNCGREAVLIPSCYELAEKASLEGELALWVGTVHDQKRPELFLELARRLPQRRFVLVGGPGHGSSAGAPGYFDAIRRQAAALPNVLCTGFQPLAAVEAWFDRARVLVNTSTYEGMPNTFLQAWARGVPTLATVEVGAPVHSVFDDIAAAAAEIERLFADEPYWSMKSAACRAYYERHHAPASVLARYAALLEELSA